jgi:hypothetical protein
VWVEGSRRYADPQRYLISNERWPSLRGEVRLQTGTFLEGLSNSRNASVNSGAVHLTKRFLPSPVLRVIPDGLTYDFPGMVP